MMSNCKAQHPESNCSLSSQTYAHLNRTGLLVFSTDPKGELILYFFLFITNTDARQLGLCFLFSGHLF